MNNVKEVGEIVNVIGNEVTVELLDSIKSNLLILDGSVYKIGQIGSFLRIPLGYSFLFGVVVSVGADAIPDNLKNILVLNNSILPNRQWLKMVLVGELVGHRFYRGVSQSPTTGDKVEVVSTRDLSAVYGGYDSNSSISLGNISNSENLDAEMDLNKLVSRHFAILGSTGSGKSNAVGVLLNAIISKSFSNSRVLVVDPHGEYEGVVPGKTVVFRTGDNRSKTDKPLFIPFWALPFHELLGLFEGSLSDQNVDFLRSKIVDYKRESATLSGALINIDQITADSPIPFSIKKLWFDLDDFERQTFALSRKPESKNALEKKGDPDKLISNEYPPASPGGGSPFLNWQAKGILNFLNAMRTKLLDSRYSFLFDPGDYSPDLQGKTSKDLPCLMKEWLGNKGQVTILDLSGIPSEIQSAISGTLLQIIYDALFWGQNLSVGGKKDPLLVILEEAHSYLSSNGSTIASRIVQKIAKEGRKYGVGMGLVTQRPSELDETVLSQCGTIIALRMNNSKDRAFVSSALQDELKSLVDILPSLRTGEAIISGEAVLIPSRIQFYKLSQAIKSQDPDVCACWASDHGDEDAEYGEMVNGWLNQKVCKKGE